MARVAGRLVPVLTPYLIAEGAAELLREMMATAPLPSMMLPGAIDEAAIAELRARVDAAGWTEYALADRGRYAFNDTVRDDALWAELTTLVNSVAGAPMSLARARWMRLRRGDYSLVKDDSRTRPPGRCIEVTLDVSSGSSGEAHVVYVLGMNALTVPQLPGLLGVVDRSPAMTRYHRPPTSRSQGGFDIVRLLMQFQ